jgi:hypothetical protein
MVGASSNGTTTTIIATAASIEVVARSKHRMA